MKVVFKFSKEKIKEVKKILEENPYEEGSFARMGYKLKEGKYLGLDDNVYLYFDVSDEFLDKIRKRFSSIGEELEGEEKERVVRAFESEEEGAAAGIGAIFG